MLRDRFTQTTARVDRWWMTIPITTRAFITYLRTAFANYNRYGARQAASLSYYAIFSIFPLTLLTAVIVSRLLGPVAAERQIQLILEPFLPPSSAQTLELFENSITQALAQSTSFGIIALVSLVWSGLGLFSNITFALDFIFGVPSSRSLWRERLTAVVMALVLLVLLVASFLTSAVLRLVSAALLERPSLWVNIGTIFLPLGLNMVIFGLLFRYIPRRRVHWDAVWPAALLGAVGWEIAKSGFDWYLTSITDFQFVYGSIATVIVLIFWAYIIASIFLISAEVCAQINAWVESHHWKQAESTVSENAVLETGALSALPMRIDTTETEPA